MESTRASTIQASNLTDYELFKSLVRLFVTLYALNIHKFTTCQSKFTWHNKRWGRHAIREGLDRGIASLEWRIAFPKAAIYHLGSLKSDHCPLLPDTNPSEPNAPRPFSFVTACTRDPRCKEACLEEVLLSEWT